MPFLYIKKNVINTMSHHLAVSGISLEKIMIKVNLKMAKC